MERAEEIRLDAPRMSLSDRSFGDRGMPRWVLPTVGVHFLFLVIAVSASWFFGRRIDELRESQVVEHEALSALGKDTNELKEEANNLKEESLKLKNEVTELRQFIASSSSEDVIFLKITILKPEIDPSLAREVAREVKKNCELYGRDPNLILAIIATESDFNPRARSSVGAVGLMQVMPQWKKVLGFEGDLTEIETSIKVGMQILGFYTEMYRDIEMVLTAYNRGPGPVDMALMRGKDPRNKYAPRVLATYNKLKRLTVRSAAT